MAIVTFVNDDEGIGMLAVRVRTGMFKGITWKLPHLVTRHYFAQRSYK